MLSSSSQFKRTRCGHGCDLLQRRCSRQLGAPTIAGLAGRRRSSLIKCFLSALIVCCAVPHASAGRAGEVDPCSAQSTNVGLEINCVNGTLAELLAALQQGAGVQADYPIELASTRVSVVLHGVTLREVIDSALPAYNFSLWTEPGATVIRLMIVGMRRSVAEPKESQVAADPSVSTRRPGMMERVWSGHRAMLRSATGVPMGQGSGMVLQRPDPQVGSTSGLGQPPTTDIARQARVAETISSAPALEPVIVSPMVAVPQPAMLPVPQPGITPESMLSGTVASPLMSMQ